MKPLYFLALLFVPMLGCQPSLRAELARLRAEIAALEHKVPEDAPMWITKDSLTRFPELTEEDIFEKHIQDHTSSIPDFVYYHVMGKLQKLDEGGPAKLSQGDFPYLDAIEKPQLYRGKVWRMVGVPVTLRPEPSPSLDAPMKTAFSGAAYGGADKPFLFYVLETDVIYLEEDTIEMYGVFIKLVSVGPEDNRMSIPLFFAKTLHKFL